MKSSRIVICDCDEEYAKALALFLSARQDVALQVRVCSTPKQARAVEEKEGVDILLLSREYGEDERKRQKAKKIFLLSEKQDAKADGDVLYKYQSGEKLLGEILLGSEELFRGSRPFVKRTAAEKGKVIGVFSPVHRIGKTRYALGLGEELAKTGNVLYLNLEVYGGVGGYFESGTQTLTDLLYYARQEQKNLGLMLTKAVHHRKKLDYVLPVSVSEDLKEVKAPEWAEFIRKVLEESIYETVILDLDEAIPGVYELLRGCTQIHVPVTTGKAAAAKMRQFEREIRLLGMEEMYARIKKVPMNEG